MISFSHQPALACLSQQCPSCLSFISKTKPKSNSNTLWVLSFYYGLLPAILYKNISTWNNNVIVFMILGLLWTDKIEIMIVFWVFEVRIAELKHIRWHYNIFRWHKTIPNDILVCSCATMSQFLDSQAFQSFTHKENKLLYILFSKKISESWISISYINNKWDIMCVQFLSSRIHSIRLQTNQAT